MGPSLCSQGATVLPFRLVLTCCTQRMVALSDEAHALSDQRHDIDDLKSCEMAYADLAYLRKPCKSLMGRQPMRQDWNLSTFL